eukprot:12633437-Alexandrium_andersonii.AAC.1
MRASEPKRKCRHASADHSASSLAPSTAAQLSTEWRGAACHCTPWPCPAQHITEEHQQAYYRAEPQLAALRSSR